MSYDWTHYGLPPESYSRELDMRVANTEMPYGYTQEPPPADTNEYEQASRNSKKEYPLKNGRAI